MYDIAIIGAGPAGATLARLIAPKYKVLLIEKRRLDDPARYEKNGKCCGGLLAPDAQAVLARLGLGLPNHVLADPQIFAVRAIDFNGGNERFYQRHYINIDRTKFDLWMAALIPGTVDAKWGCRCTGFSRTAEGYALRLADGTGTGTNSFTEQARVVVSAEGSTSALRHLVLQQRRQPRDPRDPREQHDPHDPIPKYVAIQEWYRTKNHHPYYSALFDSRITDFYAWTIPKGEYVLFGAALKPGPDAPARFVELKDKLFTIGLLSGDLHKKEGALIFRPSRLRHLLTESDDIAFIGEAAGWISPSSAEGLSWAMESAIAMAHSLASGLPGASRRYRFLTVSMRRHLLSKTLKAPFMYHPLLRNLAMRSGLFSLEPAEVTPSYKK
jgi:flavin-dependent dehydrogenase